MGSVIGSTLFNVVSVPLYYRFLGADGYSIWFYVATITASFGFADFGLGTTLTRYIGVALGRNDTAAAAAYWRAGHRVLLAALSLTSLVFLLIGLFAAPHWFDVPPLRATELKWAFAAGAAGLFIGYYGQAWTMLAQAHLDFAYLAKFRIVLTLLIIVPSVLIAAATHNVVHVLTWAAIAGWTQVWVLKRRLISRFHFRTTDAGFSWAAFNEMRAYGLKTFAGLLVGSPLYNIDRILLGRMMPSREFANYGIASGVGMRLQLLSQAAMGPLFHNTSHAQGADNAAGPAAAFDDSFQFLSTWVVSALCWLGVWTPLLLRLWLGAQLASEVLPLFMPLMIGFSIRTIGSISVASLGSMNRAGVNGLVTFGTGILTGLLVTLGWRLHGSAGAAYGFMLGQLTWFAQDFFVARFLGARGWLSSTVLKVALVQLAAAALGQFFLTAPDQLSLFNYALAAIHGLFTVFAAAYPDRARLLSALQKFR